MRILLALLAVTGCKSVDDSYIVQPGGPGGISTSGMGPDAPVVPPDVFGGLTGRVCLVNDLRQPAACASSGAGGLTVTVGGHSAQTSANGSFGITHPSGSNLVWHVTGAAIVTSVMAFGADSQIPAIKLTDYMALLGANGVVEFTGQGDVVTAVVSGTMPATGVSASVVPSATYAPFYDGATATAWNQNATGPFGVVWLPGNAMGSVDVTVTPQTGLPGHATFLVESGSITFDTIVLP